MEVPQENEYKTSYGIELMGEEEARQALVGLEEHAVRLKEELSALKEEPLQVAPEGELPKPPEGKENKKSGEEGGEPKEWKEARKRFSSMAAHGLKDSFMKGDVKGAFASVGKDLGMHAANTLANKAANQLTNVLSGALSMIPGIGGLFSFFGFQSEGLVTSPTLAMVGEREPEFVVTQERMRALMSGGRPGYGFGPGDFGLAPNVNVAAPNVNVEVSVAPGVDADIQTAYRARAGEARLSQLEG
jgi:hypothetical protein